MPCPCLPAGGHCSFQSGSLPMMPCFRILVTASRCPLDLMESETSQLLTQGYYAIPFILPNLAIALRIVLL